MATDMDTKQRRTLMIRLGAAGFILLLILVFGWWMFFHTSKAPAPVAQLGPSDQMSPKPMDVAPPTPAGGLTVNPNPVAFQQDQPNTQILILRANGGAVTISDVVMPTADNDALRVQNMDCPQAPVQLQANTECHAQVTWNGTRTINSTITIDTSTIATGADAQKGLQNAGKVVIPVSGVSTKPVQPGAGGQNGVNGIPSQQGGSVPPAGRGEAASSQGASGTSPMQEARDNYLNGRRGGTVQVAQAPGLQAAAISPYASWDNIGATSHESSFPVDMTHVITPDKPLPAVLTLPIDTRMTVSAVAMIDRDVYGENGRTVILPRGTKLLGRIGGGATDRVGIAWKEIIRPDGVRFEFDGEAGDAMGRGGVPGRINNRYLQRYGFSILPTAVSAGITAALGGQSTASAGSFGSTQTVDSKALASQILQQPLTQISNDIYQKNRNIPVQITIPAGTRITIWSTDDLRLKPVGSDDRPRGERTDGGTGQKQLFAPTSGSRPNVSPTQSQQSQGQGQQQQNGANANANGNGSLQVGQIDRNGQYSPSTTAPSPGSFVTPGNNPPVGNRPSSGTNGTGTTTTNGASTTFQPQSSPWK